MSNGGSARSLETRETSQTQQAIGGHPRRRRHNGANGNILTVNGGNGNMVEVTPKGAQVAVVTVDKNAGGAGNLFGLAVKPNANAVYFADDFSSANNLQLLS